MTDRYSRQIIFPTIGEAGQDKLNRSFAVVVGCGALGSVTANTLARAGIGKIRIIDRDFIEYHNLQRQFLFTEDDIKNQIPKAIAAERYLKKVNSSIEVEGIVSDANYNNVEKFVSGADIIIDGLDNFETRGLINDVSVKLKIPWIYGGAIASSGMTMSIIPGKTPCLRCVHPEVLTEARINTCETAGVISPAPLIIGAIQAAEAIKILVGSDDINRKIIIIDVWRDRFNSYEIGRNPDCITCNGKYEFLEGKFGTRTTSLCGQNAVQVLNPDIKEVSFEKLADQLKLIGEVNYNAFMFNFKADGHELVVFRDGRAIVKNANDEALAKGLYFKYIGV